MSKISIKGAKTHNLKNIHVDIPREALVVITGLSGSGKSSLAFDTLYAEGQRRYVESLSAYARQFLSIMDKPDVDHIDGLSPAIAIEQKSTSHNPRSTVGTVTEIYDYLRLLFARAGSPHCPEHLIPLEAQTLSQIVDKILELPENSKISVLAPVVQDRKGEHQELLKQLQSKGYIRVRLDGEIYELDALPKINPKIKHHIDVIIDRLKIKPDIKSRLTDSLETTLNLSQGLVKILIEPENKNKTSEMLFSTRLACYQCDFSLPELEPRLFSFNSPHGACSECDGLGAKAFMDLQKIIPDPSLTLAQGAIKPWDKHNFYYLSLLTALAKHYQFSLDTPFNKLPKKIQQMILNGNNKELISIKYKFETGMNAQRNQSFEGVLNSLERRYKDTDSEHTREELAKYLSQQPCPACQGSRLKPAARAVLVQKLSLPQITELTIKEAYDFFSQLQLPGYKGEIAAKIVKELGARLKFLLNVGLEYLSLNRTADTLSGGEAQRIRLASQLGAGLVGVMYVLDEPSIGLHQRDNAKLLETLQNLKNLGNSVIIVEHDEDAILSADHVIDMGPGAGRHGGEVVAQGKPKDILKNPRSLTGQYLSKKLQISIPKKRQPFDLKKILALKGANAHNLKNLDVEFPIGLLTCITGVSGSGKSTLINDTLFPIAHEILNNAKPKPNHTYQSIQGLEFLDKVIDIDQSPIGRTPRSNAATYTGLFTEIRDLFAATPEAKARGYTPGRFSFNVKGGRCEACQGDGLIKVTMHFLPDVYVACDVCQGKRYNRETLEILYKGRNIHEVLETTVEDALIFFHALPSIKKKLETLKSVGLDYLKIGQNATTLSGGEAQRIKLAKELSKRDTGKTLYILDEPTTGLHFHDVKKLLEVLHTLRDRGNTIIIIEHNLDVIKTADWIIDLGPEGGALGGEIIALGSPEQVACNKNSYTGQYLKKIL
ncbi:MAG: excinuclease ABC subunit UvrA [Gammaproteobacteria bacterium]